MSSLHRKNDGHHETARSERVAAEPVNLTDIEDSASVAAYMEQPFARARRGGSQHEPP